MKEYLRGGAVNAKEMKLYTTIKIGNRKLYKYNDTVSLLRLPDYCPKCHSRAVDISFDENGIDVLRCHNCDYSVIANTVNK